MITSSLKILGICGSLRKQSYNRMLLKEAENHLPEGVSLECCELHEIPLFNQDVLDAGMPESVRIFRENIANAHGILIASPEYNYSISGVLKNAIDWASRAPNPPLDGKPLGIMGATPGNFGTIRGQMALRQVCIFTNMIPMNTPELFVPKAHEKFDTHGNLIDEMTQKHLSKFLHAFTAWVQKIHK